MHVPISTYRLQVDEDFTLFAAAKIADYVHDLGADWLSFTPLLTAETASDHDGHATEHVHIDADRGGADGLDAAAAATRRLGLGLLIDVVPHHIAVTSPTLDPHEPADLEVPHAEIVRWITEGLADGLRVAQTDGLADPGEYLDALAAATGGIYVLVEKILEGTEQLPTTWATAGTTGYEARADVDQVLLDPSGRTALNQLDQRLRGHSETLSWADLIHDTKRSLADGILRSEVLRLERDLGESVEKLEADESWKLSPTADALAELLACFPVYRSYLPLGAEYLQHAARLAKECRPDLDQMLDTVVAVLADPAHPAAIRFQQTSAMVMAKGLKDTARYRYARPESPSAAGTAPAGFPVGVAEFHHRQQLRRAAFPTALTTLSTHDTERGEDVSARLSVLAEIPHEWEAVLTELRGETPLNTWQFEAVLWETIIGTWPTDRERLQCHAEKAAREVTLSELGHEPREDFVRRTHELVDSAFDDERVVGIIRRLLDTIEQAGWSNSLAAKLIQLTAPGVPDVYQGSELWETSFADPDRCRPVDYDLRRLYLAAIDCGTHPPVDETGAAKLLVTSRALRVRRDHPEFFTRYAPVTSFGSARKHLIGFDSGDIVTLATRLPVGLAKGGGWGDSTVRLARRPVTDLIADRQYRGGTLALGEVFGRYPVALLVPTELVRS